ncbi:transposase [Embleya sp. NPDC127516]|uniref:transposase n=1 Tax=Embleya sp. NPDC127516 TaxID=3363990 RepID=UPI0037F4A168
MGVTAYGGRNRVGAVPARRILQELIEAEAAAHIGAEPGEPGEHAETRATRCNGHRERVPTTQAGDLDPAIPKVDTGSFFPSLPERRRRSDQALYAVIMEAYVHVSPPAAWTTWSKHLVGTSGSRVRVPRICGNLDT